MFLAAIIGVAVTMLLILIRALLGPSAYDRILALNLFGTKTVLFVSVLGFLNGRPEFLDLGLVWRPVAVVQAPRLGVEVLLVQHTFGVRFVVPDGVHVLIAFVVFDAGLLPVVGTLVDKDLDERARFEHGRLHRRRDRALHLRERRAVRRRRG